MLRLHQEEQNQNTLELGPSYQPVVKASRRSPCVLKVADCCCDLSQHTCVDNHVQVLVNKHSPIQDSAKCGLGDAGFLASFSGMLTPLLWNAYYEYQGPKVAKCKMRCLGQSSINWDLVGKIVFNQTADSAPS